MTRYELVTHLHPLVALATIALLAYGGGLGLKGRRLSGSRARHAALMPWAYALVLVAWAGGVVTVWRVRDDLDLAASHHFTVGSLIVALFTAAALLSRRIEVDPLARRIHPWIGAAALLLCGVQVFLGLAIMPH